MTTDFNRFNSLQVSKWLPRAIFLLAEIEHYEHLQTWLQLFTNCIRCWFVIDYKFQFVLPKLEIPSTATNPTSTNKQTFFLSTDLDPDGQTSQNGQNRQNQSRNNYCNISNLRCLTQSEYSCCNVSNYICPGVFALA
jgi:hypothetical protein